MPRKAKDSVGDKDSPRRAAAAMPSGKTPSPQALSMGGSQPSARTTRKPLRRAAIAAAKPTGPPPITRTSGIISTVFMIKAVIFDLGKVLVPFDFQRGYARLEAS